MTKRRGRLLKLTSAIGLPALAGLVLFAWGLRLGDVHRERVLSFESTYLGMPVAAPPAGHEPGVQRLHGSHGQYGVPAADPAAAPSARWPQPNRAYPQDPRWAAPGLPPGASGAVTSAANPQQRPLPAAQGLASTPLPGREPGSPLPDTLAPQPHYAPALPARGDPMSAPPATPGATQGYRSAGGPSVQIQVKVLVDERWVAAEPRWLAQVQQGVAEASRAYRERAGIELQLSGVVRWPRALHGLDAPALLADLRSRPREGADLLLGFLAVPTGADARAQGAPPPNGPRHGAYALVGWDEASAGHLPNLLWAVGRLLGARGLSEQYGDRFAPDSWMGEGPSRADGRLWLDLENIERLAARRGLPFEEPPAPGRGWHPPGAHPAGATR